MKSSTSVPWKPDTKGSAGKCKAAFKYIRK